MFASEWGTGILVTQDTAGTLIIRCDICGGGCSQADACSQKRSLGPAKLDHELGRASGGLVWSYSWSYPSHSFWWLSHSPGERLVSWGSNIENYYFVIVKTSKKEQTLSSDGLIHPLPNTTRQADHGFAVITACLPLTFQINEDNEKQPLNIPCWANSCVL